MIRTTINMKKEKFLDLIRILEKHHQNMNSIIIKCMDLYCSEHAGTYYRFSSTRYQPRAKHWQNVHVNFGIAQYERFKGMMVSQKMSLSYLISVALDTYLEDILNNTPMDYHNTCFTSGVISVFFHRINECHVQTTFWGLPSVNSVNLFDSY